MKEMFNSKFFRIGIGILLVFLIILVGSQISFVFRPVIVIISTLFFPFLIAGFLYFLLYPFVEWLQRKNIPRVVSIFCIYIIFFGLIALLIAILAPMLQREITRLIREAPHLIRELQEVLLSLQNHPLILHLIEEEPHLMERTVEWITAYLDDLFNMLVSHITAFFEIVAGVVLIIIIVPFILFYMLRDGHRWPKMIYPYLPENHADNIYNTLREIYSAISSFIQGLVMVSAFVGVLVYIGYQIIGLDYPLLLAIFSMLTNVIPFLGPFIGSIPAVIVAALHSPLMVLKVIVVIVIVQQMESLLIAPQVYGRKLSISPLTVILLILVAGRIAGVLGMILALPTFMILKIIFHNVYGLIYFSHKERL